MAPGVPAGPPAALQPDSSSDPSDASDVSSSSPAPAQVGSIWAMLSSTKSSSASRRAP